uniref:Variant surface glycoprotein 1125.4902 n=1 Tax=Trypanosoma brucei TaxID=5691 RepID=A0A1J0RB70_9TRYP|nr:variant surface glycoprotein 1125.4902 [Trypanosoma brucei]
MKPHQAMVATALVLGIATRRGAATGGNGISAAALKPLCDISATLAGLTQKVRGDVSSKLDQLHNQAVADLKLRIYVARQPAQQALELFPILLAQDELQGTSIADFKDGVDKAIKSTAHSNFLHCGITEFLTIAAQAHSSSGTHGCLIEAGTGDATQGAANLGQCKLAVTEGATEPPQDYGHTPEALFKAARITGAAGGHTDASKNCALTKGQSGGGGITNGGQTAAGVTYAGGFFELPPNGADLSTKDVAAFDTQTAINTPKLYFNARKALAEHLQSRMLQLSTQEKTEISNLKRSKRTKASVHDSLLNNTDDYSDVSHKTAAEKTITDTYGANKKHDLSQLWAAIDAEAIPNSLFTDQKDKNTELGKIKELRQLHLILTHYERQRVQELAAKGKELQKATEILSAKFQVCTTRRKFAMQQEMTKKHAKN